MPEKQAVARQEEPEGILSPEKLISQAIEKGVPVDTMERLLAMRRELKAEAAKELFDRDMAVFQEHCPVIRKEREVRTNAGQRAYSYAPLESIVEQVRHLLAAYGFSYAVRTETLENGNVRATCVAKHRGGHSEESSMEVPLGGRTAVMSASQQVAAALTYAKRYAFCNAFGILTGDEDTDARKDDGDEITIEEAVQLIGRSSSMEDLRKVYEGLGRLRAHPAVVEAKDERKQQLTEP